MKLRAGEYEFERGESTWWRWIDRNGRQVFEQNTLTCALLDALSAKTAACDRWRACCVPVDRGDGKRTWPDLDALGVECDRHDAEARGRAPRPVDAATADQTSAMLAEAATILRTRHSDKYHEQNVAHFLARYDARHPAGA